MLTTKDLRNQSTLLRKTVTEIRKIRNAVDSHHEKHPEIEQLSVMDQVHLDKALGVLQRLAGQYLSLHRKEASKEEQAKAIYDKAFVDAKAILKDWKTGETLQAKVTVIMANADYSLLKEYLSDSQTEEYFLDALYQRGLIELASSAALKVNSKTSITEIMDNAYQIYTRNLIAPEVNRLASLWEERNNSQ